MVCAMIQDYWLQALQAGGGSAATLPPTGLAADVRVALSGAESTWLRMPCRCGPDAHFATAVVDLEDRDELGSDRRAASDSHQRWTARGVGDGRPVVPSRLMGWLSSIPPPWLA